MPAITITDLLNAKEDVEHISEIANSLLSTSTDRLGHTKKTMTGVLADVTAQAQSAQAAVLISSGIYGTTSEGLAATTSGQYFDVPVGSGYQDLVRYKNSSGAALEVFRFSVATGLLNRYGVSPSGKVQIRPDAITTNASSLGWWEINPAYMFQDRFGQTPVTATGQFVGLLLPTNASHGSEIITDPGFDTGTGWTFNTGWARTSGKAVATSSSSTVRWLTTLTAQARYVVEFDVVVTSGSLTLNLGAGTALTIPASGHYKWFPICGGAPTGGLTFTGTSFTGSVDNVSMKQASPWIVAPDTDAERGTYQTNGITGAPYIDLPAGCHMRTETRHTMPVPTYMCMALGRATATALTMASFGAGTTSISFLDQTSFTQGLASTRAGVFANVNSRTGQFTLGIPHVSDVYVEAGATSAFVNGGERPVYESVGLSSGAKRKLTNTFVGSDTAASSRFGLNYTTGGVTAANTRFYGGCVLLSAITTQQRRKVIDYFMEATGLHTLKEQEYDLFLFIGQSNMMGGAGNQATSPTPAFGTAAEYIDSGYLKPLKDPTQHSVPANVALSGSLLPAFANAYYNTCGRKVCAVGSAYSGEGLVVGGSAGTWLGPKLVNWAAFKLKNAIRDVKGIPRGAVYLGGEQDVTHSHTQAQYEGYLVQLRDMLRAATGINDFPLFLISIDDNATSSAAYALIRAAMANVVTYAEGIYMAGPYQNYLAAGRLADGIHRDQTALDTDGTNAGTYCANFFAQ